MMFSSSQETQLLTNSSCSQLELLDNSSPSPRGIIKRCDNELTNSLHSLWNDSGQNWSHFPSASNSFSSCNPQTPTIGLDLIDRHKERNKKQSSRFLTKHSICPLETDISDNMQMQLHHSNWIRIIKPRANLGKPPKNSKEPHRLQRSPLLPKRHQPTKHYKIPYKEDKATYIHLAWILCELVRIKRTLVAEVGRIQRAWTSES